MFDAKEVKIYGQAVTEFNHSVKSIPTFVLVCVGELRWNGSTAYLVSKGSYERKR